MRQPKIICTALALYGNHQRVRVCAGLMDGVFLVGNDIVDFQFFDPPLYRHIHYLDRVCLPAEAQAVRGSEHPARSLALIWACKEAAFKLVSAEWNLHHFAPRKFVTDLKTSEPAAIHSAYHVDHGDTQINVQLSVCDRWVHALATFPGKVTTHWRVREIKECPTNRAVTEVESETVRLIAKELLLEMGFKNVLWVDGEVAPRFTEEFLGAQPDISVSFSHHGSYAAAAIACSSRAVDQQSSGFELGEECSTCIA